MGCHVTTERSDQYAHGPVPDHVTIAGWRVALIVASFSIGAPDFLNGAQNALALGLPGAVLAAFLAALALGIGSCFTATLSVRTRLTTYLLVQRSFGRNGAVIINVVIALIHFGAFGVNVSFFGEGLVTAAQVNGLPSNFTAFVIIGSVLMASATLIGIRALERLALIIVPLLAIVFIAIAVLAVQRHGIVVTPAADPPVPMRFGIAVSSVVGAYMLAVATMPDLTRYVRTRRGAILAMALSFPIATPLMMTTAALPALATGETSVMKLIVALGLGTPTLFVLALPMLTVNALNLYSSTLSLSTTFPRRPGWNFTVGGAVIGTAFALIGIMDYFIPFLVFLSLIIPPITAIYVIDGFTRFRHADPAASIRDMPAISWGALATWLVSVVVAILGEYQGVGLTKVPALDATIVAAVGYLIVLKLGKPVAVLKPDPVG
jgi:cytosine permease